MFPRLLGSSFIDALSARGIVNGLTTGYFQPDKPVSRAEFAAMLQQAFDKTPGQTTTEFKDVPSNLWAAQRLTKQQNRILKWISWKYLPTTATIPRVQVLVALATGLNLTAKSLPSQTLQTYQDAARFLNMQLKR
jgi:hypothetical protein